MNRMDWERDMLLTQLDDIGIGFRQGKPYVAPRRKIRWFEILTGYIVGVGFIVAVSFAWLRFAA